MGAEPIETVAGLFEHQYVSLHVPLTDETKESINKSLLSKMPKGGCLINTSRCEVVNEADMVDMLKTRSDFSYLCAVGDKDGKRLIITAKKMGAQTTEANDNCGVAAANQIVGFFREGRNQVCIESVGLPDFAE